MRARERENARREITYSRAREMRFQVEQNVQIIDIRFENSLRHLQDTTSIILGLCVSLCNRRIEMKSSQGVLCLILLSYYYK